ncbi:MAG: pantetheine-phosphate adenylyltransferase [Candidatus Odinarchaeota archaeon]
MGGSFDHLHEGHKYLIKLALSLSKKVIIGLTTQILLKNKKFPSKIETYKTREENIKHFINKIADISRVEIIPLKDPYGPPIHEPDYESIIVSQETYKTALKINEIRESKGFDPLIIVVIPIIKDQQNQKISSTTIREQLM